MTLPSSGPMTASMINVELGRASNAPFDINGAAERALAGKPSGPISMSNFYGKSSQPAGSSRIVCGSGTRNYTGFFQGQFGSLTPQTLNGVACNQCYWGDALGSNKYQVATGLPNGPYTLRIYDTNSVLLGTFAGTQSGGTWLSTAVNPTNFLQNGQTRYVTLGAT